MLEENNRICNSCPSHCESHGNSQQEEMLNKIKSLNFAVIELALFLDTHPTDNQALSLYRRYTNELKVLKDDYQKVYGPLDFYFPCNQWRWLDSPWPWERRNSNVDL